jgi:hypothetical protein
LNHLLIVNIATEEIKRVEPKSINAQTTSSCRQHSQPWSSSMKSNPFKIFDSFSGSDEDLLRLLDEEAAAITAVTISSSSSAAAPQEKLYLMLQNIIKCLKLKRKASHPERMIGRNLLSSNDETSLSSSPEDVNFRQLIGWLWSNQSLIFSFTVQKSVTYFQLSLCLDLLKEFRKAKSVNLFGFSLSYLLHQILLPHLHELCAYPPNCLRIVDILQSLVQFLLDLFSRDLCLSSLLLLSQFHSAVIQIYSQQVIFPSPLSSSDQGSLIDPSSIVSTMGLSLFTLHLDFLCLLLRQYQGLGANAVPLSTADSEDSNEFHPSLLTAHSDLLDHLAALLAHALDQYQLEPRIELDPTCFSWLIISSLSDNDKTLLNTLNLLEELHLSLEMLTQRPCFLPHHYTAAHQLLLQQTSLVLTAPFIFSREALIIFFCQCLCFDPLILLDLISHNETVGLQYFLRVVKYLERTHSHSDNRLARCCESLTNRPNPREASIAQVHPTRGSDSNDVIQSYCSSESDQQPSCSSISCEAQVSGTHAIIWIKSEVLLSSEQTPRALTNKRKAPMSQMEGNGDASPEISTYRHSLNDHKSKSAPICLKTSGWPCLTNESETRDTPYSRVTVRDESPELWRVFQEQHHSAEELFQKIRIFFSEIETKLVEMNTQHLLPFNAAPLVRRLQNLNRKL